MSCRAACLADYVQAFQPAQHQVEQQKVILLVFVEVGLADPVLRAIHGKSTSFAKLELIFTTSTLIRTELQFSRHA